MSKYGHRPHNWLEAIVNKLGGEEAGDKFLRGELVISKPTRSWREEDGIIYFSVTSEGMTGERWIRRLEGSGFVVEDYAKRVLRSPDFKPTNGVTTEIAVLKGMIFDDDDRSTKKIRAKASMSKLSEPNPELACLIRQKFTDREIRAMGLTWIVAMHEPISVFSGAPPNLLRVCRSGVDNWRGVVDCVGANCGLDRDSGFAFAVSQISSPQQQ